jgi:tetratricopeptide (TPR) repeat protein
LLQLHTCAEVEEVERLHARYYLCFAEQCAPHLTGADQAVWILRIKREHANLLAALRWAEQHDEVTLGFRLMVALRGFWMEFHPVTEGRTWIATFLQLEARTETRTGEEVDLTLKAQVYNAAGSLALWQGDLSAAKHDHQHSLRFHTQVGDKAHIAASLNNLALVAKQEGEIAHAKQLQQESVALKREIGDTFGLAMSLMNLGNLARGQGQYTEAETSYQECLYLYRSLGHTRGIAGAVASLGRIAAVHGDTQQAVSYLEEAVHLFQRLGAQRDLAATYINLGEAYGVQTELVSAHTMVSKGLKMAREMGLQTFVADGLECLADVVFQAAQVGQAVSLFAAAAFLRDMLHYALPQQDQQRITLRLEQARELVGETAYRQAWTLGRVADIDDLIAGSILPDH